MSVWQNFRTGECYINGVLVTAENHDRLVNDAIRAESRMDLLLLRNTISHLWSAIRVCPERDRIIALVDHCITAVDRGDQAPVEGPATPPHTG